MALNRRELIRGGLLAPVLTHLSPAMAAAGAATPAVWVIDRELPAARALERRLRGTAAVHGFSADPGPVWMNELAPRASATRAAHRWLLLPRRT